jgi:hypothetical protein
MSRIIEEDATVDEVLYLVPNGNGRMGCRVTIWGGQDSVYLPEDVCKAGDTIRISIHPFRAGIRFNGIVASGMAADQRQPCPGPLPEVIHNTQEVSKDIKDGPVQKAAKVARPVAKDASPKEDKALAAASATAQNAVKAAPKKQRQMAKA